MPCYHPSEVPIRRKSLYSKRQFSDMQVVPCGNCIGCRAEQSRQWAVRMMHENRMHENSCFITLTYSDKELPEDGTLRAKHFSGFIKNLRKTQERRLSYFGCGEYGERTQRPHYHALLFGIEFLDRDTGFDTSRPNVWRSQSLEDIWGRGIAEGGNVTMASASYVSGYMRKKVKKERYERSNPLNGVLLDPEFARMSLRPAIGLDWIKKWWADVYPRDFVVIDGVEAKPPRYYDKYMDRLDEHGGHGARREVMETVRQRRIDEQLHLTRYTLLAGEMMHKSRTELFQGRDAL